MILYRLLPPALPTSDHLPPPDSPFHALSYRRMLAIFEAKEQRELRGRLGGRVTIVGSRN